MKRIRDFWKGKRVLVTGHEGFLGSWLTRTLIGHGCRVTGVDIASARRPSVLKGHRGGFAAIKGDVADSRLMKNVLRGAGPDIIFHLAAEAIVSRAFRDTRRTFRSNIEGTWNLLECCRGNRSVRAVVVASSDKAYGSCPDLPYQEDTPLRGEFPYDASKSCADILARMYWRTFGLPVCVMRCGNIYGPGDINFTRIVPDAVRSAVRRRRFVIRSDGRFTRDYVYVEDIVSGYMRLAGKMYKTGLAGEAFNLSDERPLTVLELFKRIQKISGADEIRPRVLNKARYEIRHQYLSSRKAGRVLGWRARHSLDEGLRKTIEWYRGVYA